MKTAYILVGLSYGDEGKGTITDFLCRHVGASLVVRYNGGGQAAHNVVTADGKHHCFSQFGSGTLAGARTHLSRFMLVDPFDMSREAEVIIENFSFDPVAMLSVDPRAVVVTPYHKWANRLREKMRGANHHGSVGKGVGEARQDQLAGMAIGFGELRNPTRKLEDALRAIQHLKLKELGDGSSFEEYRNIQGIDPAEVADFYRRFAEPIYVRPLADIDAETVVFEGAQGIMLDEQFGYAPYNSWTCCTARNALDILDECGFTGDRIRIGITRTYATRHGRGPFVTEDKRMQPGPDEHNHYQEYMKGFRVGHLDIMALRYAIHANEGIDGLAITHADWPLSDQICIGYRYFQEGLLGGKLSDAEVLFHHVQPIYKEVPTYSIPRFISTELRVPIHYMSYGPRSNQKKALVEASAAVA